MTDETFREKYGPVALVTGASSGIGKAFAEQLAAMGMRLVLVARRVDRLEALATQLQQQHGVTVSVVQLDLAAQGSVPQLLAATASLDVGLLVCNAGFSVKGEHSTVDTQVLTDMLAVNCSVPMLLTNGFIPRLRGRGRGGILLVSSIEGLMGCPFSTAYSSSKAFVKSLGEGLWGELTPQGIDVLTVCPGATDTEALRRHDGGNIASMPNVTSADDVARGSLGALSQGPIFFPSEHYRAMFERLTAMPRRDALQAMAAAMAKTSSK
jgi:short-subunit dehydrogenase